MSASPLLSRLAIDIAERKFVAEMFVDPIYLREYGTTPPLADAYAVIESEGSIKACLGIEWPGPDGRVHIERAHRIVSDKVSGISFENKVQFSRWASIQREATIAAVYVAVLYSLDRGKLYAFVEQNTLINRCVRLLGIPLQEISHGPFDLESVRKENREFYAKNALKPRLMDLRETEKALRGRVPRFTMK